jgi:hypothetical protein
MADFRIGVVHKGPHDSTTIYGPLDEVYAGGGTYRCILTTTNGILVTNTTYWQPVTKQGDVGATGPQGTQGATGATGPAGIAGVAGAPGTVNSISSSFDSNTGTLTIG